MGNDNVLIFLVDFHNLEFHSLVYEYVVVADRANVNLRTGKEGLDAEYVNDHAALGAGFNVAFDDLVVLKSLVDTIPAAGLASFLVGKTELAVFVFEGLDENFHFVADFEVGIVAEF